MDSATCFYCKVHDENFTHMFWTCSHTKQGRILLTFAGNKLNWNFNVTVLLLQETYTSTDTSGPSWVEMGVGSYRHHTGLCVGGSMEIE